MREFLDDVLRIFGVGFLMILVIVVVLQHLEPETWQLEVWTAGQYEKHVCEDIRTHKTLGLECRTTDGRVLVWRDVERYVATSVEAKD